MELETEATEDRELNPDLHLAEMEIERTLEDLETESD